MQGISAVSAKAWIRDEQLHTGGANSELQMDARRGLEPQRNMVRAIAARLRMQFDEHVLEIKVDGAPVKITMYARPLDGVAAWFARSLTDAHCTPRRVMSTSGQRVYGHSMWSDWAINEYGTPAWAHTHAFM